MGRAGWVVVGAAGALLAGGCAGPLRMFSELTPPRATLRGIELSERPSARQLEAALCPRVLREGPQRPGETTETCMQLVGPAPSESLSLTFDLDLVVENQNYVAMPLSEVLVGVNLFPEDPAPWEGVSCMALCPAGDPYCWTETEKRPCEGARRGVPSEGDYVGAHPDLVYAKGVLLARGDHPRRDQLMVPARSKVPITARFSLVPGAIVEVLTARARDRGADLRQGKPLPLSIPYEIDGAVYVVAPSGKRLGQSFGPVHGTWSLAGTVAQE
jgi:hypothetical protein